MGEYTVYLTAVNKLAERRRALEEGTWQQVKQGTSPVRPGNGAAPPLVHKTEQPRGKVNVAAEILLLVAMRERVSVVCDSPKFLKRYRNFMTKNDDRLTGLSRHISKNKLRETEDKYNDEGHQLSFNKEILFSYDLCGACEAHAILIGYQDKYGKGSSIANVHAAPVHEETLSAAEMAERVAGLPLLADLKQSFITGNVDFAKCPVP